MSAELVAARLRQFLLLLAAVLCLGTVGELFLLDHLEEPLQFVPFILCGLGVITLAVVLLKPQRTTILIMRITMILVALGGLLGIYEHLAGNQAFALEIDQQASGTQLFWESLTGGSPAFAPGILIVIAIVAYAATYYHPALTKEE